MAGIHHGRRLIRACLIGLLAVYLILGAVHLGMQLGAIPPYGDTPEYLILASVMKVDQYRGILYPAILAGFDQLSGGELLKGYQVGALRRNGLPSAPPGSLIWVQLVQLLLSAFSIVYALSAVLPKGSRRRLLAPLAALVFLDPVVTHLNLSILTDGMCLSFLLIMAGGLASLLRPWGSPLIAWSMVLLGGMGSTLLRVEKAYAVALVLILVALFATSMRRRGNGSFARREAVIMLCLALAIVMGSQTIQSAFFEPTARWPREISWLHERVIRPQLQLIRLDLPYALRQQLSTEMVEEYDYSVQGTRRVMNELSLGDPERLATITHEMAGTVLRKQPHTLVLEVARNGIENLFITPTFYLRLTASATGLSPAFWSQRADGNVWTYRLIDQAIPRVALYLVIFAGLLTLAASVYSVSAGIGAWRRGERPGPQTLLVLSPFVLLWIVNAAAFTAAGELVHIRYGLIGHVTILGLVWFPALQKLLGNTPPLHSGDR